jgi:hypothetical protein
MVGSFIRLAAAAALSAVLAGCASGPDTAYYPDSAYPDAGRTETDSPLQCVPYAREQAHVSIYGDAYTWWEKAAGRYVRSDQPSRGAVMVLFNYAGPNRAHLAVVREVVGDRELRIDHANWLDDGAVYVNDPVRDVSAANDWSQVRVFNIRTRAWGTRVYAVQGFIGPDADTGAMRLAGNPPEDTLPDDPIASLIAGNQDLTGDDN